MQRAKNNQDNLEENQNWSYIKSYKAVLRHNQQEPSEAEEKVQK